MSRRLSFVAAALVVVACRETRMTPTPLPVVRGDSGVVFLTVSDTAPVAGAVVRVVANLRLPGDSAAASYTARLAFDSSALRFAGEEQLNDGALRASNGLATEVRVAGAAVNGFVGPLFAARFEVRQPGGLGSLRLIVHELHDASSRDLRGKVRIAQGFSAEPRQ